MSGRRGVWWFIVLLTLVGTGVLFVAFAMRQPAPSTTSDSVIVYDVPDEIEEAVPPNRSLPYGLLHRDRPTLFATVRAIDHAAHDSHVLGLVLHIDALDWGWAKVAELRDALGRFRAEGKPVYACIQSGGDREYFLASVADQIVMPPTSVLRLDGLTLSVMFLRGTLDKLDIHPNFVHAGQYKSAIEQYTRTDMSPPAREALDAVLDDTFSMLIDTLATARGIEPDSVRRLIDGGPYGAAEALQLGLLDGLGYIDDADSTAVRAAGSRASTMPLSRYLEHEPPDLGPHIAYVAGSGTIVPGKSRYMAGDGMVLGSETMIAALREARERRSIRAIVLRVDSPGGSVEASDDIWREVDHCRKVKPVIVSMSDLAASGGYYLAAPATAIVAQPATLTGSIGVFGGKLNILGLYRKLGINVETVSRGLHAEMLSPFKDFTAEEAERYQVQLDDTYRTFLARVSAGRRVTPAYADSVGQGRVWSGRAAFERSLVDTLGGLDVAFRLALRKAGLSAKDGYVVDVLPHIESTFFDRVLEGWFADDDDDSARLLSPVMRAWIVAARFPAGDVFALMPWSIDIR